MLTVVVVVGFCLFPCGEKKSLILGFQSPGKESPPVEKNHSRTLVREKRRH
jgi:hypothetical protein